MARDKNVLMTDGGSNRLLPSNAYLQSFARTGTPARDSLGYPKSSTLGYGSGSYASRGSSGVLAPDMDRAMRQAKINLGYLPSQPSGMPSSDYQKWLDMYERQNANKSSGNIGVGAVAGGMLGAISGATSGANGGSSGSGGNGGSGGNPYQSYYNNSVKALEDAYAQKLASLQGNLDSTKSVLKNNYDLSKGSLLADTEKALQEAYVNKMMNERSLAQQLNSQGLSGGASESAVASMLNNYGNSRNNINTAYTSNLAQLEQAYLNNLAQAQQSYNDAVAKAASDNANYRLELENALYKAMFG